MKKITYMTTEEIRRHPELVEPEVRGRGTRFEGSTEPRIAFEHIKNKSEPILECGPIFGPFTQVLVENGFTNVHTLDFVDLMKSFPGREKVTSHVIDFNFEKMPYPDNFFGGACAWGIGEHLENQFFFFRELHRVLKPGGILIFSVPNMFHILSRLIFLKTGMFPRWSETNNHITVLPRGVFHKTVLRYFDLVKTEYIKPRMQLWNLDRFSKWLPANQWFGDYVVYVLKARK